MSTRGVVDRAVQCGTKKAWRTKKFAKKAMRRMQSRVGGRAMEVYLCPHCDGWHAGHRPRWSL